MDFPVTASFVLRRSQPFSVAAATAAAMRSGVTVRRRFSEMKNVSVPVSRGGALRLAAQGFPQGLLRVVGQGARRRVDQLRDTINHLCHLPSSAERSEAALSVAATTDAKSLARSTSMPAAVVPPGVATPEMKASRSAPDWRR